jgi:hypothetical protein
MRESSPGDGMPTRYSEFNTENITNPITYELRVGRYNQTNGWKSWGNHIQGSPEESKLARRHSSKDKNCVPRNMLVGLIALEDKQNMLLEVITTSLGSASLTLSFSIFILFYVSFSS